MPAPVKEIRAEYTANGRFRQQRARGVLLFSTIASEAARNQRLVGTGQQGKLTLLLKDEE
ncbi:hypothetical protein ACLK1T_25010 [Escherichia coli]